jgi:hypothetical protein
MEIGLAHETGWAAQGAAHYKLDFNVKYCIKCVASVLFVVLGFCGYSQTPQKLGDQIADADCAVAYCVAAGSTFSVTGEGTKVLIHAIATAEKHGGTLTAPAYWIQFYRQTNLLGSIGAGGHWFMNKPGGEQFMREEYFEKGGVRVLEAWEGRLETDKTAKRAFVNLLAEDVIKGAGVTNLQIWSVELLKLYESGRFGRGFPDRDGGSNFHVSPQPKVPGWAEVTNRVPNVFDPDVYVHCSPSGKPECVFVSLVGLPIPYGLALGSTNYATPVRAWYTTNYAPGIYAFHRGY